MNLFEHVELDERKKKIFIIAVVVAVIIVAIILYLGVRKYYAPTADTTGIGNGLPGEGGPQEMYDVLEQANGDMEKNQGNLTEGQKAEQAQSQEDMAKLLREANDEISKSTSPSSSSSGAGTFPASSSGSAAGTSGADGSADMYTLIQQAND